LLAGTFGTGKLVGKESPSNEDQQDLDLQDQINQLVCPF
jgi:hypothetical protein